MVTVDAAEPELERQLDQMALKLRKSHYRNAFASNAPLVARQQP
jgi:hypothetical protein